MNITLIIQGIGCLIGILLAFVAWRGKENEEEASAEKDPRISALIYGLSSFLMTLVMDWKSILGEEAKHLTSRVIAEAYISGLLIGFTASVSLALLAVGIFAWQRTRNTPMAYGPQPLRAMVDFLFFGYRYVYTKLDKSVEAAEMEKVHLEIVACEQRQAATRDFSRECGRWFASELGRIPTRREAGEQGRRETVIRILELMEQIVFFHVALKRPDADYDGNSNLMLAIPFADACTQGLPIHFVEEGREYEMALTVWEYRNRNSVGYPLNFALPVPYKDSRGEWRRITLPGAPSAFVSDEMVATDSQVAFPSDTEPAVRHDVVNYLESQHFRSFLTIPIAARTDGRKIGVINIEASDDAVMKLSPDELDGLRSLLDPYAVLVGLVATGEI